MCLTRVTRENFTGFPREIHMLLLVGNTKRCEPYVLPLAAHHGKDFVSHVLIVLLKGHQISIVKLNWKKQK